MINMTTNKEDKKRFITDITYLDGKIIVDYADGTQKIDDMYTEHNYNVYRRLMERQVRDYSEKYLNKLSRESFYIFLEMAIPSLMSIIGMYYLYNSDISLVMKIIITILVGIANLGNILFNEIWTTVCAYDLDQTEAYRYYVSNINKYKTDINREDYYILPIEDIQKHELTYQQVVEIGDTIDEYRTKYGNDCKEIKLNYKKNSPRK